MLHSLSTRHENLTNFPRSRGFCSRVCHQYYLYNFILSVGFGLLERRRDATNACYRPPSYKGGIGLPVMLVLPNLVVSSSLRFYGLSGSPDSNHLSRRVECLYPHRATPVTVANCSINRILQLRQHCQAPSDSEISADSSRIVREALNPDAWTID